MRYARTTAWANMGICSNGLSKHQAAKEQNSHQFNFCPGHPTACPKSLPSGLRTASDNWHWVTKRKRQEKQWHACTKRHQFNAVLYKYCMPELWCHLYNNTVLGQCLIPSHPKNPKKWRDTDAMEITKSKRKTIVKSLFESCSTCSVWRCHKYRTSVRDCTSTISLP